MDDGFRRSFRKRLKQPAFVLVIVLWVGLWVEPLIGQAFGQSGLEERATLDHAELVLPAAQAHPLPPFLAQWQDVHQQGDYFELVEPSSAGHLIWSQFPVQIYIEPTDSTHRAGQWYEAVSQAVQEWNDYLPLTLTTTPENADITIRRSAPPIQRLAPPAYPNQSLVDRLPRIRAAETRYQIQTQQLNEDTILLGHRFTIYLSPNQTNAYTKATARHELGHALGIWGHSPNPTDALYFSQVQNSPPISNRDINTLKRIYQQPTHLGWTLSRDQS